MLTPGIKKLKTSADAKSSFLAVQVLGHPTTRCCKPCHANLVVLPDAATHIRLLCLNACSGSCSQPFKSLCILFPLFFEFEEAPIVTSSSLPFGCIRMPPTNDIVVVVVVVVCSVRFGGLMFKWRWCGLDKLISTCLDFNALSKARHLREWHVSM